MVNYQHLFYFWTVAREGGVVRAASHLHLTQPTISTQIRVLESSLGAPLLLRKGRGLELTDTGRLVFGYAEEIFGLGREMMDAIQDRPPGRPVRLTVGVADVLPKLVVRRLLAPAMALGGGVHLVCREDKVERLLAELSVHAVDVVLSDTPTGPGVSVKAYNHLLGECPVAFFARPADARRLRRTFPRSLETAPVLLPTDNTALRRSLGDYFAAQELRPNVVAEFEDSALMKAFGQGGAGAFPAPLVLQRELRRELGVVPVGTADGVRERFYAISVEKRLKHPAVVAISEQARLDMFARGE